MGRKTRWRAELRVGLAFRRAVSLFLVGNGHSKFQGRTVLLRIRKSLARANPEREIRQLSFGVTAHKQFSNVLQSQIDSNRDLIFAFLREAAPDIASFVKKDSASPREFIVVEVKTTPIKLDDIDQTGKYAELFDARYALLISAAGTLERPTDCAPSYTFPINNGG